MPQRDEKGRFIKGGGGGPGRPRRATEGRYMDVLMGEVTSEYWAAITRRAIGDAMKGVPEARRWLSDYVLGKPPTILELRAAEAALLADVLRGFERMGMTPAEVFGALAVQIGLVEAEAEDEEGDDDHAG